MNIDKEQAAMMQTLCDAGHISAKKLTLSIDCTMRTAYRLIKGESPLTARQSQALIVYNDRIGRSEVGNAITRYILSGSDRLAVDLSYHQGGDVHADTIAALRHLADALEQRRQHEADGIITQAEAQEEVQSITDTIEVLYRARKAASEQKTSERKQARR